MDAWPNFRSHYTSTAAAEALLRKLGTYRTEIADAEQAGRPDSAVLESAMKEADETLSRWLNPPRS